MGRITRAVSQVWNRCFPSPNTLLFALLTPYDQYSPPRRRGAGYRNVSMQRRSVSRGKVSRGGSPAAGTLFSTTRRGRNISPVCTRVSQVKVREATHTGHTPHNTVLPTAEPSSVRRRRKQAKLARFAKRKPEFLTSPEQLGGDKTAASTVLKTRSAPPPSTRR